MIATTHCAYSLYLEIEQHLWYGGLNYWRVPLRHGPVRTHRPLPLHRYTPRPCRSQAARWKRRRFVQSLRKTAA